MQVTVFMAPGFYCFTPDEEGGNLPSEHGPWNKFKIINLIRGEAPRIAVDTDKALDAIKKDGFYLQATRPSNS